MIGAIAGDIIGSPSMRDWSAADWENCNSARQQKYGGYVGSVSEFRILFLAPECPCLQNPAPTP